jgi:hypothetical protein
MRKIKNARRGRDNNNLVVVETKLPIGVLRAFAYAFLILMQTSLDRENGGSLVLA